MSVTKEPLQSFWKIRGRLKQLWQTKRRDTIFGSTFDNLLTTLAKVGKWDWQIPRLKLNTSHKIRRSAEDAFGHPTIHCMWDLSVDKKTESRITRSLRVVFNHLGNLCAFWDCASGQKRTTPPNDRWWIYDLIGCRQETRVRKPPNRSTANLDTTWYTTKLQMHHNINHPLENVTKLKINKKNK